MDDAAVLADDGVRLWAVRSGDGVPVVFCHGGPGLWDTLGDAAALLLGDGVAVYRWDQRGAGRSERCGPYSVGQSVADLDAVRRHFGLDRMTLLGHSWGAQLALEYALRYPERVERLVYVSGIGIDPSASWRGAFRERFWERLDGERLERWTFLDGLPRGGEEDRELCVLQWSTDFADPDPDVCIAHAERMATPWFGVNFECSAAINAENRRDWGTPALRARCTGLRVATLIVDGELDLRPRDAVDSLEAALPEVSRVVLKGAGHLPWVEEPAGFGAAVRGFVLERGGPGDGASPPAGPLR
ncbi:alpha/beta fold hydrolase [Streptacidiphilus carbonis]|uniref:alpha/beta fold hydrolase n=1 Tax=Streptacidiphilus carbonis TaxID=105422 RepID=UPI0005A8DA3C|nr:alpha/beta hydrolase [Streptacidiphilus carbonis]